MKYNNLKSLLVLVIIGAIVFPLAHRSVSQEAPAPIYMVPSPPMAPVHFLVTRYLQLAEQNELTGRLIEPFLGPEFAFYFRVRAEVYRAVARDIEATWLPNE